ncbi:MAG: TraR/DksA family transcriptional regulator [Vicinamibacteria bacterium]
MPTPERLRDSLTARRMELLERVRSIEAGFRRQEEPLEKDADDQSLQIEDDDVLKALDEAGRKEIESIDRALARMQSGAYGICARCDEQIAAARLAALPTAVHCIRCAEQIGR